MGLGFGQAMPPVGINPFAEGLSWMGLQPFELLKGFEQIRADLDQPVAAGGLGIVRAGVGGGDAEMAFKGRQPRFEGDPVGVPPAVVNANGQHHQWPLVVGFLQILSGPGPRAWASAGRSKRPRWMAMPPLRCNSQPITGPAQIGMPRS